MGIYIKEMSMPSNCFTCKVESEANCPVWIGLDNVTAADYKNSRYPGCPLVEIKTPHGRLIDADALADDLDYDDRMFHDEIKANAASWLRSQVNITLIEPEE